MKITARIRDASARNVALDCKTFWGRRFTVYAALWRTEHGDLFWVMPSGRRCTKKMLDAIDQLDQVFMKSGAL